MNERILELAKTAGLKFPSETALSPSEKKFAELIARECADLFAVEYGNTGLSGHEVARVLKKRFGIEP